jgi:adhesin/invasin
MRKQEELLFFRRFNRWRLKKSPWKVAFLLFLWLVAIMSEARAQGDIKNNGGTINNTGKIRVKGQATGLPSNVGGTFEYFGAAQTVPSINYNNLQITGTGVNTTSGANFSVNGNLTISNTAQIDVPAPSVISLNGNMVEQGYLSGSIQKTVDLSALPSSTYGDIGTTLSWTGSSPGLTTVKRTSGTALTGQSPGYSANQSIKRYYDIALSNTGFNGTFDFKYHDLELNGQNEATLELWRSPDNGVTWRRQGGAANPVTNTITKTGILAFSRWTASDAANPLGPPALEWVAQNIGGTSGSGQSAPVNTNLGSPFVITVTDGYGNAIAGTNVTFAITGAPGGASGQSLTVTNATTNASGQASSLLRVGSVAGTYTVTVTSGALVGSPLTFTASATGGAPPVIPPVPTAITLTAGNGQTDTVGKTLANLLTVTIVDQFGAPFGGVAVNFTISGTPSGASGQSLTTTSTVTAANGRASTQLTLGSRPGTYAVVATSPVIGGTTITFSNTAVVGRATMLASLSGNGQTQVVKTTLAQPFVVVTRDQFGNPIPGVTVAFAVKTWPAGSSTQNITDTLVVTNAQGQAQTTLQLGDSLGVYEVSAASGSLIGSPVIFAATATAAPIVRRATSIAITAGNSQVGVVGTAGGSALVVTVYDQFGAPFAGESVTFALSGVPSGDTFASLTNTTVVTDSTGRASTMLLLGHKAGTYAVTATSASLAGSPMTFTVAGVPGVAKNLTQIAGLGQSATVNSLLQPFVVSVTDTFGNAKQGVSVQFAINTAPAGAVGQTLSAVAGVTNSNGLVSTQLRLGDQAGVYQVTATAAGLVGSPATFSSTALLSAATSIVQVAGVGQSAPNGSALAQPFTVRALSASGNPVPGVMVTFAVDSIPAGATGFLLSQTTAVTGADGTASTILTLGDKTGIYRVTASSSGLAGSPIFFRATATGAAGVPIPSRIVLTAGSNQADTVGRSLANPFVITVLDQFGAPYTGAPVTFALSSAPMNDIYASLSATSVVTDASGQARTSLVLGHKPGSYMVTATSGSIVGSPIVFTANAVAGRPMLLAQMLGNQQTGLVRTTLANRFVVSVTDTFGNVKQGVDVQFAVTSAPAGAIGQSLTSVQNTTDVNGRASAQFSFGDKVGTYQVTATAPGLIGSPSIFTVTASTSSGSDQTGFLQAQLVKPFSILVLDPSGNPVRGASVTFTIDSIPNGASGQSLNGRTTITVTTDSSGVASVSFTLGNQPGLYRVSASVAGVPGVGIIFYAVAVSPVSTPSIVYTAGNGQSATILTQLTRPFVVTAMSPSGAPLAGEMITFAIDSMPAGAKGQMIVPTTVQTDAAGRASVMMKLGSKAGTYRISAFSDNLAGGPILFRAQATAATFQVMLYVSGDGQVQQTGNVLESPFVVGTVDIGGNPVPGVAVQFAIDSVPPGATGQRLSVANTATDSNGIASTVLTLGNVPGVYRIVATHPGYTPIVYRATAKTSTGAVRLAYTSGNGQSGLVAAQLASPIVVTVLNEFANPVAGQPVTFAVDSMPAGATGASVTPTTVLTNASGRASAVVMLGSKAGTYRITATSSGLIGSPVEFRVRAASAAARTIAAVAGNGQTKAIATSLDTVFVVRVVDGYQNPVPGIIVDFSIDSIPNGATGQKLTVLNAITDQDGQAAALMTLGSKVGDYVIAASAPSLSGSPVLFRVHATSAAAAALLAVSGNDQTGGILSPLLTPFVVSVVDIGGNPVPGVNVRFALDSIPSGATGQSLRVLNATTDAKGQAAAILTLGSKEGRYTVTASSQGLIVSSVRFAAIAAIQRGDVNLDRGVDIADLTSIIDNILGRTRLVANDSVRADVNRDGRINVADVVALQNNILAIAAPVASVEEDPLGPAWSATEIDHAWTADTAKVQSEFVIAENSLRFNVANTVPLKGLQLMVRFKNPVQLRGSVDVFQRALVDSFFVSVLGNELRLVAYNLSNKPISVGDGTLFRLPVQLTSIGDIESGQLVVSVADSTAMFDKAVRNIPTKRMLGQGDVPYNFVLYQNYPNPFNGTTKIEYEVPDVDGRGARVLLQVFDLMGSKIKTLVSRFHYGGRYAVVWDGKDEAGRSVSSGTYYYRLISGDYMSGKKMILLK